MKQIAETLAPACTPLHASALRRVASGVSMFDEPTRCIRLRDERGRVAQELRRWCLVTGNGEHIELTRAGHAVLRKIASQ